ncbi:MAG: enoyl-CoA hydratase-related protein [Myxococcales bacterium]|nr:enoyl-CoA hydratase-related protein [Myxococcales bacterium]
MSDELVLLSHDDDVSTLTINRPDALNALNASVLEALDGAIERCAERGPRCLIVTGAGEKAFVAGADIAAMSKMDGAQGRDFARLGQRVLASLEALPFPVIAAVNGFALGGGTELALACDFIYASDKAKFGQPEVKLGIIPGFGGTQRLARRVGPGLARELIYTGRMIGHEEALRIGLANAVVPRRELLDKAREVAAEIVAVSPRAVAGAKDVMNAGAHLALDAAVELEAEAFADCFGPEQHEGMGAFLEKRPPKFK